jgi:hypothetical protein
MLYLVSISFSLICLYFSIFFYILNLLLFFCFYVLCSVTLFSISYSFLAFYDLNPNPIICFCLLFIYSYLFYHIPICCLLFVLFSLFIPAPLITSYVDYIKEFQCSREDSPAFGSSSLPGSA